jgi:glucose/arabinose dehydrogenase
MILISAAEAAAKTAATAAAAAQEEEKEEDEEEEEEDEEKEEEEEEEEWWEILSEVSEDDLEEEWEVLSEPSEAGSKDSEAVVVVATGPRAIIADDLSLSARAVAARERRLRRRMQRAGDAGYADRLRCGHARLLAQRACGAAAHNTLVSQRVARLHRTEGAHSAATRLGLELRRWSMMPLPAAAC